MSRARKPAVVKIPAPMTLLTRTQPTVQAPRRRGSSAVDKLGGYQALLGAGLAVIEKPMLPIEPRMAEFMNKDVTTPGYGKPLANVNGLIIGIPDSIRISIALVHFGIGQHSDIDSIPEREDNAAGNSGHNPSPGKECWTIPQGCEMV